jgi:hypothetical protein
MSEEKGSRCTTRVSVLDANSVVLVPPASYVMAVKIAHVGQSENIGNVVAALFRRLSS